MAECEGKGKADDNRNQHMVRGVGTLSEKGFHHARTDVTLRTIVAAMMMAAAPVAISAATPREMLLDAAFQAREKPAALAQIERADQAAAAVLARDPRNDEAIFVRAMALGYRAKLTRNRGEALAARRGFDALAAASPRDAEAAAAVGTWHLDSVIELGGMLAGVAIGAKKATGYAMMDKAVALGGGRAIYSGLGALLRLSIDPADPRGRALAEQAATALVVQPIDRVFQRSAAVLLVPLKAGKQKEVQSLAKQLLPFGRVKR